VFLARLSETVLTSFPAQRVSSHRMAVDRVVVFGSRSMATTTLKHSFYYYIGLARNGPQVCTILKFVEVHLPNKVLCTQHETSLRCTTQEQVLSSQKGFWIQSIVSHGVRTDRAVTRAMNKARCNAMHRSILKRLDSTRFDSRVPNQLQVGKPRDRRRFQQLRKLGHNDRQDRHHEGKVPDPVLSVGRLDLGHELFLGNRLGGRVVATASPLGVLSLLGLDAALFLFQIGGIDPVVFSHVPPDGGNERSVFLEQLRFGSKGIGICIWICRHGLFVVAVVAAPENSQCRPLWVAGPGRVDGGGCVSPATVSSSSIAVFRGSFLEHPPWLSWLGGFGSHAQGRIRIRIGIRIRVCVSILAVVVAADHCAPCQRFGWRYHRKGVAAARQEQNGQAAKRVKSTNADQARDDEYHFLHHGSVTSIRFASSGPPTRRKGRGWADHVCVVWINRSLLGMSRKRFVDAAG